MRKEIKESAPLLKLSGCPECCLSGDLNVGLLPCLVVAICSSIFIVDPLGPHAAFPHCRPSTHSSEQLEAHLFSKIIVTLKGLKDGNA